MRNDCDNIRKIQFKILIFRAKSSITTTFGILHLAPPIDLIQFEGKGQRYLIGKDLPSFSRMP